MKAHQSSVASHQRRGVITTTCISVVSVVGVLVFALLGQRSTRGEVLVAQEHEVRAFGVGEMAITLAVARIRDGYQRTHAESARDPQSLKTYLEGLGILDQRGSESLKPIDVLPSLGIHQDQSGAYPFGGGFLVELTIVRLDSDKGPELTVEALAKVEDGTLEHRVRRVYEGVARAKEE